jgi:hypothetical protein
LKRLRERAVEARHVNESMIRTDVTLDQAMSDLLRVLKVIAELPKVSSPAMAATRIAKGRPPKRALT